MRGIEAHRPGVGHLIIQLEQAGITNVRIYCHDAIEILTDNLADNSLSAVHLFFPDPWPKKKHHKRRIVQASFLNLLAKTKARWLFSCRKTDWEPYAKSQGSFID
ncbi:MAG: hypothetical protein IPN42_19255 [Methylococcaceae bacterium]|nr:hypothetical protein [Methylococcaceae bacterium]